MAGQQFRQSESPLQTDEAHLTSAQNALQRVNLHQSLVQPPPGDFPRRSAHGLTQNQSVTLRDWLNNVLNVQKFPISKLTPGIPLPAFSEA